MNACILVFIILTAKAVSFTPCVQNTVTPSTISTPTASVAVTSSTTPTATSPATSSKSPTTTPSAASSTTPTASPTAVELRFCGDENFLYDSKKAICCIDSAIIPYGPIGRVYEGTDIKCCGEKSYNPSNETCCHGYQYSNNDNDFYAVHPGKNLSCCLQFIYDPTKQSCCGPTRPYEAPEIRNVPNITCQAWVV